MQKEIFLNGEAQVWLNRNKGKYDPDNDPVLDAIVHSGIQFSSVLEIGCSEGYRLQEIKKLWKCYTRGVDPIANDPVTVLAKDNIDIWKSTADDLPFQSHHFDLVIFGFCLYLCDPKDYFKIAAEADRVLKPGGCILIYDFEQPTKPYSVPYKHKEGVQSYHFPWNSMFSWHPHYSVVYQWYDGLKDLEIGILEKVNVSTS